MRGGASAARAVPAIALACICVALVPAAAGAAAARTTLPDVEDEVMCTICGTLLAESQSPQADRERALIRTLIARGESKDQIKDALVAEYGPRVLATPSGHGFDLLAWIVPILGILLIAVALVLTWVRPRRRGAAERKSPPPLDAADAARLSEDMSKYDR